MMHNNDLEVISKYKFILLELLLENKVLNYFVGKARFRLGSGDTISSDRILIEYCKQHNNIHSWVDRMGSWNSTRQGHQFWADINAVFIDRVDKAIKGKVPGCRSIW